MSKPQRTLLLLAALFFAPFLLALALRFGGWQPGSTRNYGELLSPPLPMHDVRASRDDGGAWTWVNTEHQWTLLVRVPQSCDDECARQLDIIPNVRVSLGRHAGRLHVFRLDGTTGEALPRLQLSGSLPAPLLTPPPSAVEAFLVDPHGFLVLRYAPGFDPSGLRRDLSRLIR